MEKTNIAGKGEQRRANQNWFTGRTWMKVLSEKIKLVDQDMYHVHFEEGSRTKLHFHNGNQMLITTKGEGSLEIFRRFGNKKTEFKIKRTKRIALKEGDIVHIPARVLHTHGSISKTKEFAHIALNIRPKRNAGYETVWYESDFRSKVSGIII